MAALLGDGLPALRITAEDVQVDRKLPEAKQKSNITPQKDAKENRSINSKQLKANQAEREVLEIIDPTKRVVSKSQELFERL